MNTAFYHQEIDAVVLSKAMQVQLGVLPELTGSELEFLSLCCSDLHYREIAPKMNVSERTIDSYRDSLFKKLQVKSRPGLVTFAMLTGLGPKSQKNV
ncbi:MAG: helix-turn-helix transcriptional regulator [Chitinophagales bacterium]|nr:helix-turn-helix transcriptional regulator [Chitinophagales bacterium]